MRVLVCDDHSLFREGLRLLLEKLDPSMEVTLTGSAEDAVAATRDAMFDLILLDWHMDGLAGERALEALRESAPLTRVVVLSGDRNAELVRSAVDFGAAGFIPKDSPPAQLMSAVRTIADGVKPSEYGRREAFRVHQALKARGPVTVPREFVFMDRAAIGLGAVFLHLAAELNFYRLFNEAIEAFAVKDVASRQAAALAKVGL